MKTIALSFCLAFAVSATAGDWRQFRGPHSNGVSDDAPASGVLLGTNCLAWQTDLPGRGLSSPIVVGDRVFVTCSSGLREQRLHVICFRTADGAKLWERQFWATGRTMCHEKTCVAAPSPASDGQHIVATFSSNDIVCLDLDGNLIWVRGLGRDYPQVGNSLGMSASLLVAGGVVVAQVESQSEAFTLGLDVSSGLNRWKLDRPKGANWTSPALVTHDGTQLVALQSAKGLAAIEPATGRVLWNHTNKTSWVPSCTPIAGSLLIPAQGLTALNFAGADSPKIQWQSNQLRPGTPSPTVWKGTIFTLNDGGVLTSGNAATGERLWQLRLKGPFSASPVVSSGFIYCVSEKGVAQVVDPSKPEGQVVSEVELGETVLSTPAVAHGALYIRSDGRLWRFGRS